jgi:hypothetical protein
VDPDAVDQRLNTALAFFSSSGRRELLRILDLLDEERIREISRLYQDGTSLGVAELLMDLEAEPSIRRVAAAKLLQFLSGPSESGDPSFP